MTGMKFDNNQMQALAFIVMLAVISVLWDFGRAAAMRPDTPASAWPTASQAHPAGGSVQFGLIQTGIVGVSQVDAHGGFGQATAMPVFQVVRLAVPGGHASAANVGSGLPAPAASAQQNVPTASGQLPSGISVTPSVDVMGSAALCDVNNVRVMTPSAEACVSAGGQVAQGVR